MTSSALIHPESARTRQAITVLVVGRFAFIEQSFKDLLRPVLTVKRQEIMPTRGGGFRVEEYEVPLWSDEGNLVVFPAGLVSRLVRAFEGAGNDVRVRRQSPPGRELVSAIEMLNDHRAGPEERDFLRKLQHDWLGQILYRTTHELAANIARIACFFPDSRIFVITTSRRSRIRLARQVRGLLDRGLVFTDIQEAWLAANRLYIGTAPEFASVAVPDDWDVVLVADPRAVLMPASRAVIDRYLAKTRVYAFVRVDERWDDWQRFQLERIAGEVLYVAPGARMEHYPTRVVMVTPPGTPVNTTGLSALERKRTAVWHNEPRNRAIVGIALGLAAGNDEALWQHGVFLPEDMESSSKTRKRSVVIYVESLEHARELEKLWQAVGGQLLVGGGTTANRRRSKSAGQVRIVTLTRAYDRGLIADVLVRADGTADPLTLLEWKPARGGQPRFLVDFRDDVDDQAVRDTARRLADYEAADWKTLPGYPPGQMTINDTASRQVGYALRR